MKQAFLFLFLYPVWAASSPLKSICTSQLTLDFGNSIVREHNRFNDPSLREVRKSQLFQQSYRLGFVQFSNLKTLGQIFEKHPELKFRFVEFEGTSELRLLEGKIAKLKFLSDKHVQIELTHQNDAYELELKDREGFMVFHPKGPLQLLFE